MTLENSLTLLVTTAAPSDGPWQAALSLARVIGLPGEAWPILSAPGGLYVQIGEQALARQAYQDAAVIINRLAETIEEDDLRKGFLMAVPVRNVLANSEVA